GRRGGCLNGRERGADAWGVGAWRLVHPGLKEERTMPIHPSTRNAIQSIGCWVLTVVLAAGLAGPLGADEPKPPPPAKALTPEQHQRLQERDRYAAKAQKLRQAGKLVEAIAAWEQKIAIERAVLGDRHEDLIASLKELADLHEAREDFAAARPVRQEVLALSRKRYGDQNWRVTNARLALELAER